MTVVCVALTGNLKWTKAPGNVTLPARETGLPRDSVANVSQILTLDRSRLSEQAGTLRAAKPNLVLVGIDAVFDR